MKRSKTSELVGYDLNITTPHNYNILFNIADTRPTFQYIERSGK
jgi:hypothetical protein